MLLAVCHSQEGWSKVHDLESLSELRQGAGNLLWAEADVTDLTPEDIALIAEEFDLHPLAVEDAAAARQRPKLEPYANHIFMTLHELYEDDGQLEPIQLGCFIGPRYVLTIHHGASRTIEAAKARWAEDPRGATSEGPAHLVHTLLDVIVDDYQSYAAQLEDEVETLEDVVLETPNVPIQRQLYSLKQRSSRLRRYALPVERVIEQLLNLEEMKTYMPDETKNLFRDVQDHVLRMTAQLRNVDDLSQAVLDLVRGQQAEALGIQGRKLSAWAAIFAAGTLVAGVYGMNFALVPKENSLVGFWFALALMAAIGVGLYLYFKKRGWL
jgi:magnesium transporter